jgi:chemotaxis protein CheD
MPGSDTALPEIHIHPGESRLVTEPVILRTVLGSCIGLAFLVPRLGVAALCHPMLPTAPPNARSPAGCRYVDFAIRDLARQFDARGARRTEVQVKLFGGGDVLLVPRGTTRPTVGRMNQEAALRVLAEEGFSVAASSLGGICGLNLRFHTGTGEVLLWRLC